MISKKAKAAALAAAMVVTAGILSSCSKADEDVSSMISNGKSDISSVASKVGEGASDLKSGAESNLSSMASNGKVDNSESGGSVTSK